ncbi:GtrA family protein [Saccharopolyspora shandongensis]|uniref:GtrA family protein n=1 Tax=Saccharopolyspora shandongensis TaxID=418495 RepID=UPI003F4D9A8F
MAVAEPAAQTEPKRLGAFNQLFRFVLIGGVCAIIDFGTYSLMLGVFGWPVWLSRGISFILGTSTSYVINRKLTFQGANTGNTKAKAGAFALVYIVTFFVNWGTNQLLVVLTGAEGTPWMITACWVAGQGLGTLINFVMLKWVVFRD